MCVGFFVLDISKGVMYNFFYSFLKPRYGDNCRFLYTDTDSLILHITANILILQITMQIMYTVLSQISQLLVNLKLNILVEFPVVSLAQGPSLILYRSRAESPRRPRGFVKRRPKSSSTASTTNALPRGKQITSRAECTSSDPIFTQCL